MTELEIGRWQSAFAASECASTAAQRIHDAVCVLVREGDLSPEARLPSGRWMAENFAVSRGSVADALDLLVCQGVLERSGRTTHRVARSTKDLARRGDVGGADQPTQSAIEFDNRRFDAWLAPTKALSDAFREAASNEESLNWNQDASGDLPALLWQIRLRLLPMRRLQSETEDIIPVRSAREALALSLKALLKPGQAVLFDDPHRYAVESSLLEPSVRQYIGGTDACGLKLDGMPECDLIVLAPSRQGPDMTKMGAARRSQLMHMARKNGIRIVEVDYEVDHLDGGDAPLKAQDQVGQVLYIGIPASAHFGLGGQAYICAPEPMAHAVREARRASGGHPDRVSQAVQACYLARGAHALFLRSFRDAVTRLGQRLHAEIDARHPLLRLESVRGNGYACIHAPPIASAGAIQALADAASVAIVQVAGTRYWVDMCVTEPPARA